MKVEKIFKILLVLLAVGLAILAFRSIMRPEKFKMVYNMREAVIVERLSAIRSIQAVYKNEHKRYTADIDSLVQFVNEGTIQIIKASGQIPEGMNEEQAYKQGLIWNDTIMVPAKDKILESDPDITHDILKVFHLIPESNGKKYEITLGVIESQTYTIPVYRIEVPLDDILVNMERTITPEDAGAISSFWNYLIYDGLADEEQYRVQYNPMWLGSLTESTQSGSWE